jgi:molybdenum cofactor synthesis domain-containing protein
MSNERMRVGVLIVSDRRAAGEPDGTGPGLVTRLEATLPGSAVEVRTVPDEIEAIVSALRTWIEARFDLVVTSGGTGFAPRDVTPEATRTVIDRPAPGLVIALVTAGLAHTPLAMLSRPEAGIAGSTLVVNLPGSPTGAYQSLDAISPALRHALAILRPERGIDPGHAAA